MTTVNNAAEPTLPGADATVTTPPDTGVSLARWDAEEAAVQRHLASMAADSTPLAEGDNPPASDTGTTGAPPATTPRQVLNDLSDKFVTIKVDGVDSEISLADLVRDHQKGVAAEQRFREAAQLRQEAEQIRQQATAVTPSTTGQDNPGSGFLADLDPDGRDLVDGLFQAETNADVLKALEPLLKKATSGNTDVTQVAATVKTMLTADEQLANDQSAYDKFLADYADISQDADLNAAAAHRQQSYMTEQGMSYGEALLKAADDVRARFAQSPAGSEQPTPAQQRQRNKENLRTLPSTGRVAQTTQPKTPTYDDIRNEERKARGLM